MFPGGSFIQVRGAAWVRLFALVTKRGNAMSCARKTAVSDFATPPLRLGEGPFRLFEVAAMLRKLCYKPASRRVLRKIVTRLNAAAIWFWYERDAARSPTLQTTFDTVVAIERYTGKLLNVLGPSGPGAWHDLDDYSPDLSPALVGLLDRELSDLIGKRLCGPWFRRSGCIRTRWLRAAMPLNSLANLARY
jgi:hypothetical protein